MGRLPNDKYGVMVVDLPWPKLIDDYNSVSKAITEFERLPLKELAAEKCALWVWAPNTHIHLAVNLIDTWQFSYRTMFTYVSAGIRTGPKRGNVDPLGLFGKTEQILLATRGNPLFSNLQQFTAFCSQGRRSNSFSRPLEFYLVVEKQCPTVRRIAEFYGHGPTRVMWDRLDHNGSIIVDVRHVAS